MELSLLSRFITSSFPSLYNAEKEMSRMTKIDVKIDIKQGPNVVRADLGRCCGIVQLHAEDDVSDANYPHFMRLWRQQSDPTAQHKHTPPTCDGQHASAIFEMPGVEIVALFNDYLIVVTDPEIENLKLAALIDSITEVLTKHEQKHQPRKERPQPTSPIDMIGDLGPVGAFGRLLSNLAAESARPHEPGDNLGKVFGRILDLRPSDDDKEA
jgi:hypothetical protein